VDADYDVELPQAFVAGEEELKKLARLLADRIGSRKLEAYCADDVRRTFKSPNDLIAYENSRDTQIRRLRISAQSDDDFTKRTEIDLSGSWWRGISLHFHARDDVVSRLRAEVLDIIAGMKPWYAVMLRFNFVPVLIVSFFVVALGILAVWILIGDPHEPNLGQWIRGQAFGTLIGYGGMAFLLVFGLLLNRFRDTLFPSAVFLIGQGKGRFDLVVRFQWGIVIAFFMSFAAGLVILLLQIAIA
jgi:hypothetical protein